MPDSLPVGISAGNLLKASSYFVDAVPILSLPAGRIQKGGGGE